MHRKLFCRTCAIVCVVLFERSKILDHQQPACSVWLRGRFSGLSLSVMVVWLTREASSTGSKPVGSRER